VIAGVLALSLSSLWFMSRVYRHGVLSVQVRMHIGTRLVRSQGISVATVIGFVAAADTGRFERVEDGKCVGVVGTCWRCRRVLAGLDSSGGVIIVVMRATRRKKAPICRLC
jgi:hypothetical protein